MRDLDGIPVASTDGGDAGVMRQPRDSSEREFWTAATEGDFSEIDRLIDRLLGSHEWGYRDPVEGGFVADNTPFDVGECLRALETAYAALEDYEDADHDGQGFIPNGAMKARQEIREAIQKATHK